MGRCNTISSGLASAAMMINSVIPLFKVLVASLAPFLICLRAAHWANKSWSSEANYSVANGWARSESSYINQLCTILILLIYFKTLIIIILYQKL